MRSDTADSVSTWMRTARAESHPPLENDLDTDVCVVGAGIAGLTAAYLLAREGRQVVVLDDGPVGGGETSRTSAHLASALDDRYTHLESLYGQDGAKLAAKSHAYAIDLIDEIAAREGIDCDFRRVDGFLVLPPKGKRRELEDEEQAARRAGLGVELLDRMPFEDHDFGPALCFRDQAQFHPMKYLAGLSAAFRRLKGVIHTGTHVGEIVDGKPTRLHANGRLVRAGQVVVATNSPISDLVTMHTKQASYRTYVVGLPIPRGSVPPMLLWDTLDPYHYVRVVEQDRHDLLLVGGEDHKTGQLDDPRAPYRKLEKWARTRFPKAQPATVRWSGQVVEPQDSLAFIGRDPAADGNRYLVTGDSGNGLTHGSLAGRIIGDLILGRENPYAALYAPSRKTLRAAGTFTRENLNVAAQFAQLATPGEVASTDEIRSGTGAIVRRGLRKIAAYRDEKGALHEHSAFCTHLGCVVQWNSLERSWDCPCHGSRFDKADGHVLNGPAISALSEVEHREPPKKPRSRAPRRASPSPSPRRSGRSSRT